MPLLYTIAYPELAADVSAFVDGLRAAHDPQHATVGAHFTLLFGSSTVDEATYTAHVQAVAASAGEIAFACRRAIAVADAMTRLTQVHLVPDEGCGAITRLHDCLYSGIMAPLQRLDIGYVPHITIAAMPDRSAAVALCDTLNRAGLDASGRLRRLTVGALRDGRFEELSHHALEGRP